MRPQTRHQNQTQSEPQIDSQTMPKSGPTWSEKSTPAGPICETKMGTHCGTKMGPHCGILIVFQLKSPGGHTPHLARYACSFWARFSSPQASSFSTPRASFLRACGAPGWAGLEAELPPREPRRFALDVHTVSTSQFDTPTAAAGAQPRRVLLTTPRHTRGRGAGCRWAVSLDILTLACSGHGRRA